MPIPRVLVTEAIEAAGKFAADVTPSLRNLSDDGIREARALIWGRQFPKVGAATPLEFKTLIARKNDVAVFGEPGYESELTELIASGLPQLNRMGFSKIGLPSLGTSRQPIIDSFMRSQNPGPARTIFGKAFVQDTGAHNADSFLGLMDSAKALHVDVFALKKTNNSAPSSGIEFFAKYIPRQRRELADWVSSEVKREPDKKVVVLGAEILTSPLNTSSNSIHYMMSRKGLNPIAFGRSYETFPKLQSRIYEPDLFNFGYY